MSSQPRTYPTRRRFLKRGLLAGAALAAGASMMLSRKANAYYSGPVSDHFDGLRFFNPGGRSPKGLSDLARLYVTESFDRWPDEIASPFGPDRPPKAMPGQQARLVLVGHATWLIQAARRNILLDPVWSERASPVSFAGPKRANPPGIAFEHLPAIHVVLVTHNHYDHLDIATLARLRQHHAPRIITPLGNDTIIRAEIPGLATEAVDWGQSVDLGHGLAVHCVPTQHWSARGLRDRSHALWASFILETPAGKIYAVGDSGFGDGRTFRQVGAEHPDIALALLPIGAYEPRWFMSGQHMNPAEAVEAMRLCGAPRALGHHWGTFQLTKESHDLPPRDLARACADAGVPLERFLPMRPGEIANL